MKEKKISVECGLDDARFVKGMEGFMENEKGVEFDLEAFITDLM